MPRIGGCDSVVGVYASYASARAVVDAVNAGWRGIADQGGMGTPLPPYAESLGADQHVQDAYAELGDRFWWLSFWTVSWPAPGDTFYNAGYAGGCLAAQAIVATYGDFRPAYVILDPEGYNEPAGTAAEWADFVAGFADGVRSVDPALRPGFYCNQWQYTTFALASIDLPAFLAVSPVLDNIPMVCGGNVAGYIAYYATCPAGPAVYQVAGWGARWNTVQFAGSGVEDGPTKDQRRPTTNDQRPTTNDQ